MKSIRFIRDVAVHAIHREQGSVHELEDHVANFLISDGCAVVVDTPPIETTESPQNGRENAMKKTAKKPK